MTRAHFLSIVGLRLRAFSVEPPSESYTIRTERYTEIRLWRYLTRDYQGVFLPHPRLVFFRYIPKLRTDHRKNFIPYNKFGTCWQKENSVALIRRPKVTSEWRHIFPVLGINKGLQKTLSRKQPKEPTSFQQKVENERFYQTGITDFQNSENFKN